MKLLVVLLIAITLANIAVTWYYVQPKNSYCANYSPKLRICAESWQELQKQITLVAKGNPRYH